MNFKKNIKKLSLTIVAASVAMFILFVAPLTATTFAVTDPAPAQTDTIESKTCDGIKLATGATDCGDSGNSNFSDIIKKVINILSILVGAVSVIMLIIGGFRYIISNGDANSTKGAKDTILYALIGLIIVLFAQVIVRFVWTNASKTATSSSDAQGTPK